MDSLYLLIPIAVVFVTLAVAIFFWAVDNNQFDDLEGPAHSILFDEPAPRPIRETEPAENKSLNSGDATRNDRRQENDV